MVVLTDIDADRYYLFVLIFSESVVISFIKLDDGDLEEDLVVIIYFFMYFFKCFVFVLRFDYFEIFKV